MCLKSQCGFTKLELKWVIKRYLCLNISECHSPLLPSSRKGAYCLAPFPPNNMILNQHFQVVLSSAFSPTHWLLATGCLSGRLVWHQPVIWVALCLKHCVCVFILRTSLMWCHKSSNRPVSYIVLHLVSSTIMQHFPMSNLICAYVGRFWLVGPLTDYCQEMPSRPER